MSKKFKIYTLGCKVNQYDAKILSGLLQQAGFSEVKENADIVIINTCAVTKTAIRKDRQALKKAREENSGAKIVLMGCWPQVYKEEIDVEVDLLWGVGDLEKLAKKIISLWSESGKDIIFSHSEIIKNKSRYFLKIQDGCEQFCTYCIIPYARGKMRSRSMDEICKEATRAVEADFREIILCGIHLGLYGVDFDREVNPVKFHGVNLVALLRELIKIESLERVRLSSIEVTEVSDDLIKLMGESEKICRHLHISLQSGCDKILKSMNRPYDSNYFEERVNSLRKLMPNIAITTDIIVGFPGETEADFAKTYDFAKKIKFSRIHVFPFSAHEKTPAFSFPDKVNGREIKKRADKLRMLSEKMEADYINSFCGSELKVVVESIKNNKIKGKSEFYFDVEVDMENVLSDGDFGVGDVVLVRASNLMSGPIYTFKF